jgi:hypothetical protein
MSSMGQFHTMGGRHPCSTSFQGQEALETYRKASDTHHAGLFMR